LRVDRPPEQKEWLDRIREHLVQNLSIDRDDFDTMPLLQRVGGWGAAKRAFGGRLSPLLVEIKRQSLHDRRKDLLNE